MKIDKNMLLGFMVGCLVMLVLNEVVVQFRNKTSGNISEGLSQSKKNKIKLSIKQFLNQLDNLLDEADIDKDVEDLI